MSQSCQGSVKIVPHFKSAGHDDILRSTVMAFKTVIFLIVIPTYVRKFM